MRVSEFFTVLFLLFSPESANLNYCPLSSLLIGRRYIIHIKSLCTLVYTFTYFYVRATIVLSRLSVIFFTLYIVYTPFRNSLHSYNHMLCLQEQKRFLFDSYKIKCVPFLPYIWTLG